MDLKKRIAFILLVCSCIPAIGLAKNITVDARASFRICFDLDGALICSQDTHPFERKIILLEAPPRTSENGGTRPFIQGTYEEEVEYKEQKFFGSIKIREYTDGNSPVFFIKLKTREDYRQSHELEIETDSLNELNSVRLNGEPHNTTRTILIPSMSIKKSI